MHQAGQPQACESQPQAPTKPNLLFKESLFRQVSLALLPELNSPGVLRVPVLLAVSAGVARLPYQQPASVQCAVIVGVEHMRMCVGRLATIRTTTQGKALTSLALLSLCLCLYAFGCSAARMRTWPHAFAPPDHLHFFRTGSPAAHLALEGHIMHT